MATRYFAGNTLASFSRSAASIAEVTTANTYDSAYVGNSITMSNSFSESITSATFSATGIVWVHYEVYVNGNTSSGNAGQLNNGATGVFRLDRGGDNFQPQYWNGSAWTNTGAAVTLTSLSRTQIDIMIDLTSGAFELYKNKVSQTSGSGWSGHQTTITNFIGHPCGSSNSCYSQVMVADYDLRESKYMTAAINGNGTYTDGTGAYTDVDETVLSDADAVNLSAVGNKKGFTKASITVSSGYMIGAAVVSARGLVSGGVVTEGKLGVLSAGDVSLSSSRGYTGSYGPGNYIIPLDPDTGATFTQSGFNSAEAYIEAA